MHSLQYTCLLVVLIVACKHQLFTESAILRRGNPLNWKQAKPYLSSVRKSGVKQFINHFNRVRDVKTPKFYWGDELEYGIFSYDEQLGTYDLSICGGTTIQENLNKVEKKLEDFPYGCIWQPEYGSWMVEAVPRDPYNGFVSNLLLVEKSMQLRRKRLHSALKPYEIAPSMSGFPLLGVAGLDHSTNTRGGECEAMSNNHNNISQSDYLRDFVINPHPRFGALTQNIRSRRGEKVDIRIPKEDSEEFIQMDAMAFGMVRGNYLPIVLN